MASLGMACLGAFIGWIVSYGLVRITDWSKPGNVLSGVISAAVAGGVFTFIQMLGGAELGEALFLYPLGLAYGAVLNSLGFLHVDRPFLRNLHIVAITVASLATLAVLFTPALRERLPGGTPHSTVTAPH